MGTLVLIVFLVVSCDKSTEFCNESDTRYLVFLDKSSSAMDLLASTDSSIVIDLINYLGAEDQLNNGTRILGYYLHENTLGSSPFLNEHILVKCPNLGALGAIEKDERKKSYFEGVKQKKVSILKSLREAIRVKNEKHTRTSSDIWATFELMSRFFDDSTDVAKMVFYISDMKESMPGEGRRNLHKTLPATKAEAESMALADAEVIKRELKIKPEALKGVEVRLFFPDLQLVESDKELVLYYWEALFGEMGVGKVREGVR